MTTPKIPFVDLAWQHRQIEQEVTQGIARVLASTSFVDGPDVTAFEAEFAAYCAVEHCLGVANGTDAIELALRAAGIGAGDEVILPTNSFVATAEAVVRAGAVPVMVDADERYLLIDPAAAEAAVGPRTAAIIAVHLFGQMAPMAPLAEACQRHGLALFEDAAQSQGARQNDIPMGGFGLAAATSFYPGKNLGAYGDGGAVLTNDDALAAKVRCIRNHGSEQKYVHTMLGFNSRLDARPPSATTTCSVTSSRSACLPSLPATWRCGTSTRSGCRSGTVCLKPWGPPGSASGSTTPGPSTASPPSLPTFPARPWPPPRPPRQTCFRCRCSPALPPNSRNASSRRSTRRW